MRWIIGAAMLSAFLYFSTYGFTYDKENYMKLVVNGDINPRFNLLPWMISSGVDDIPKESDKFWWTAFAFMSFRFAFGDAIWYSWKRRVSPKAWEKAAVVLANRGVIGIVTLILISSLALSIVDELGSILWMFVSYVALVIFTEMGLDK